MADLTNLPQYWSFPEDELLSATGSSRQGLHVETATLRHNERTKRIFYQRITQ